MYMLKMCKTLNIFSPNLHLLFRRIFTRASIENLNIAKLNYVILKLVNAVRYHRAMASLHADKIHADITLVAIRIEKKNKLSNRTTLGE